ncbi:putative aminopeptidase YsdC [bioreactor metagenome]|uniref:Putative aminopeptidase YsdC n=2 Tax=root TaxID=1 RepID=A0A645CC20_9ZZZZ
MLKQNIKTELDVYYAFTVQEEVGCRGGKIAAFNIAPDVGIAVDVVSTGDYPIEKGYSKDLPVKLGSGPSVRIKDGKIISDKNLNEAIINIAKKNNIKYQVDILLNAGTDAASMQQTGSGAASTCINIPTRYIHSPNEMISKRDIDETLKLLCAFLEEYNN